MSTVLVSLLQADHIFYNISYSFSMNIYHDKFSLQMCITQNILDEKVII